MEERKFNLKNVQLILRPNVPVLKILVILLVVFSMAALISLGWVQYRVGQQTEQLRWKASELEQANSELERKIADLGSVTSVEEIARDELGLVRPDTIYIKPE